MTIVNEAQKALVTALRDSLAHAMLSTGDAAKAAEEGNGNGTAGALLLVEQELRTALSRVEAFKTIHALKGK